MELSKIFNLLEMLKGRTFPKMKIVIYIYNSLNELFTLINNNCTKSNSFRVQSRETKKKNS